MKEKSVKDWAKEAMIERIINAGIAEKTQMSINALLYETSTGDFETIMNTCEALLRRDNRAFEQAKQENEAGTQTVIDAIANKKRNSPLA